MDPEHGIRERQLDDLMRNLGFYSDTDKEEQVSKQILEAFPEFDEDISNEIMFLRDTGLVDTGSTRGETYILPDYSNIPEGFQPDYTCLEQTGEEVVYKLRDGLEEIEFSFEYSDLEAVSGVISNNDSYQQMRKDNWHSDNPWKPGV